MRRWHLLPVALVAALVVALPVLAFTDTGVEYDVRDALGLNKGECEPATNESSPWRSGPSLPFLLDEPRAAALDGDVYIAGGIVGLDELPNGRLLLEPSDRVLRFDPETGRYTELAPLPRPLNHIGVVGYDHDLYVLGGYGRTLDTNTSKAVYRYQPARDRWSQMPDMPAPRAAMAVAVVGDRLVVAGGARDRVPVSGAFAFDFGAGRWSRLPSMPGRREHVGSVALDGRVYVLGGRTSSSSAVTSAASYDVEGRRWRSLPPLPTPSGGMAVVATDRAVLGLGGGDDGAGTVTGAVQEWDPAAESWKLLDEMRTPRHGHAAAIADGKVWVFGGSPCAYFAASDSVEWLPVPGADGQEG
jgi:hypothetical protein